MLHHKLKPLIKYLAAKNLHELHADFFGEVFQIIPGQERKRVSAPELDEDFWWGIARAIANEQNITGMDARPYLRQGVILDGVGAVRLTLSMGETLENGLMFTARRITPGKYTVQDFGLTQEEKDLFDQAVIGRWNIVITGAMDSGKTSFLNALIKLVPKSDRIATIQDIPELAIKGHFDSYTGFILSTSEQAHNVGARDILDAITRGSYKRVWLGEANITNTWLMLRALDFGLGGFIGTIHGDSARLGLDSLVTNCRFQGYESDASREFFSKRIHLFAHFARDANGIPRLRQTYMPPAAHDQLAQDGEKN